MGKALWEYKDVIPELGIQIWIPSSGITSLYSQSAFPMGYIPFFWFVADYN